MKKVLSILIMFLCVFTINVFALNVDIEKVEVVDKSYFADEGSNSSIDGNTINYNLRFQDYEQFITYKITLKNNTSDDYGYDVNSNLDYMDYTILDDNKVIAGNSTKEVLLKVSYKKEIDESLYNADNKYNVTDKVELLLNTESVKGETEITENPKTGLANVCGKVLILLFISLVVLFFIRKNGPFKYSWYVLVGILLVYPFVINASTFGITINMNFDMEIEKPTIAVFDIGANINTKMKELAGDVDPNENTEDNNISAVKRNFTKNNNSVEVQSNDSDNKIYMWYDSSSKTIYYYSEARRIRYNEDAKYFYSYLRSLSEIDDIKIEKTKYCDYMFQYASKDLDSLNWNISNWDVSNMETFNFMFFNFAEGVEKIELSANDWHLKNASSIYHIFYQIGRNSDEVIINSDNWVIDTNPSNVSYAFGYIGDNASSVIINASNWQLPEAKSLSYLFSCSGYRVMNDLTINFDNVYAPKVEKMDNIFIDAGYGIYQSYSDPRTLATTINISNLYAPSVTDYHNAFQYASCSGKSLEIIGIEDLDMSKVTDVSYMFYGIGQSSTNHTGFNFDIKKWDLSNVENFDYFLYGYCQNSTEADLTIDLTGLDTSKVSTMKYAFAYIGQYAKNLDFIAPNMNFTGLSDGSRQNTFSGFGYRAENVKVDLSNLTISNVERFVVDLGDKAKKIDIDLSGFDYSGNNGKIFGYGAGVSDANDAKINLSNWSLDNSSILTGFLDLFGKYSKNIEIDLSNWDLGNRTSINELFNNAYSNFDGNLTINVTGWDISNITSVSNIFSTLAPNAQSINIIGADDWNV